MQQKTSFIKIVRKITMPESLFPFSVKKQKTKTKTDIFPFIFQKHKDLLQLLINAHKSSEKGGELHEQTGEMYNGHLTFDEYKKRGEYFVCVCLCILCVGLSGCKTVKCKLLDMHMGQKSR